MTILSSKFYLAKGFNNNHDNNFEKANSLNQMKKSVSDQDQEVVKLIQKQERNEIEKIEYRQVNQFISNHSIDDAETSINYNNNNNINKKNPEEQQTNDPNLINNPLEEIKDPFEEERHKFVQEKNNDKVNLVADSNYNSNSIEDQNFNFNPSPDKIENSFNIKEYPPIYKNIEEIKENENNDPKGKLFSKVPFNESNVILQRKFEQINIQNNYQIKLGTYDEIQIKTPLEHPNSFEKEGIQKQRSNLE